MSTDQIDFGTDKKSRDNAFYLVKKLGIKSRRFTLRGQIYHGRYIGDVYYLETQDPLPEGIYSEVMKIARQSQESLRFPSDFDKAVRGMTETSARELQRRIHTVRLTIR